MNRQEFNKYCLSLNLIPIKVFLWNGFNYQTNSSSEYSWIVAYNIKTNTIHFAKEIVYDKRLKYILCHGISDPVFDDKKIKNLIQEKIKEYQKALIVMKKELIKSKLSDIEQDFKED